LAVFDFGHFWKKEKCPFYKNGIQNFAKNAQKALCYKYRKNEAKCRCIIFLVDFLALFGLSSEGNRKSADFFQKI